MFGSNIGALNPTVGSKSKRPKSRLGTRRAKPPGMDTETKIFDITPFKDLGVSSFPGTKALFNQTPSPNSEEESKDFTDPSLTLSQRTESALKDILNTPKIDFGKCSTLKSILSPMQNLTGLSFNLHDSALFATPTRDFLGSHGNSTGGSDDSFLTAVDSRIHMEAEKSLFKEQITKPSHFNKENNEHVFSEKSSNLGHFGDMELFQRVLPKDTGKKNPFLIQGDQPKTPVQPGKPSFFKSIQDGKSSRVMTFAEAVSPFKRELNFTDSLQDSRASLNTALSTDSMFEESFFKKPDVVDGIERRKGSHFGQASKVTSDDSGFSQASMSNSLKETFLIDDGHHQYRVEHVIEENKKMEYGCVNKKEERKKGQFHLTELGNALQGSEPQNDEKPSLFRENEPRSFKVPLPFESSPKSVLTPQLSTPRQDFPFGGSKEKPERNSQPLLHPIPSFFSGAPHRSKAETSVKTLFQDVLPSSSDKSEGESTADSQQTVVGRNEESFKAPPNPPAAASFDCFKKPLPVVKKPPCSENSICVNGKAYRILSLLGRGGSSEVYQVFDGHSSSVMAVKCVKLSGVDEKIANEYINEVELLSKLQGCSSVIRMQDSEYVQETRTLFVVMEKGDTDFSKLMKNLSGTQKMSMAMITYYWTEMLTCVKDIHDRGIIHSDLKPANFLLVCGRLKLIDFGIASSLQDDMTSVLKEVTTGTFNYMSPEAIRNSEDSRKGYKINYKSDVWSLGCILCNMIYGKTPFSHIGNAWAKLQAIADIHSEVELPKSDREIPLELRLSLHWCLMKDPKSRPSVDQLLELTQSSKIFEGEDTKIFDKLKYDFYSKLLPSFCHRRLEAKVLNY